MCALGSEIKPTTERYSCSGILMSFIAIFVVLHHYQKNRHKPHVLELVFLMGCPREELSALMFFVVSFNNLFKNAIIWGKIYKGYTDDGRGNC